MAGLPVGLFLSFFHYPILESPHTYNHLRSSWWFAWWCDANFHSWEFWTLSNHPLLGLSLLCVSVQWQWDRGATRGARWLAWDPHIPPCPRPSVEKQPNPLFVALNYSEYGDSSPAHSWAQEVQSVLVTTIPRSPVGPTVAPGRSTPSLGTKASKFAKGTVAGQNTQILPIKKSLGVF